MSEKLNNKIYLKKEFQSCFEKIKAQGNWLDFFEIIEKKYQKPPRSYHTFDGHITFCITELKKVPPYLLQDENVLLIAIFFHDAVMKFFRNNNEESSAKFAFELFRKMGIGRQFSDQVNKLILSTKHNHVPNDYDAKIIADIDLAIFGQSTKVFCEYEKNIRKEYSFVPEKYFFERRIKLFEYFINRPSIFLTEYFQDKYENIARKNLQKSIFQMKQ